MKQHRNSQKRYYLGGYAYFVTGVTQNRFSYFKEEIFCEVFLENLRMAQELKRFELHGWFLGYDHFHILVTPGERANISEIMRSLKSNVSCDINRLMNLESEVPSPRFQEIYGKRTRFFELKSKFHKKYSTPYIIPFPKFQWLKSFHDHVIRNKKDFENHMRYIQKNLLKHQMPEGWRWIGLNLNL